MPFRFAGAVYAPGRLLAAFRFLATVFLIIRRRERFLFLRPLSPVRLKETVLYLGVSFIKLSQVLATRADFFPAEYLDELRAIHDEVPPMSEADLDRVLAAAYPPDAPDYLPFAEFSRVPMASASIGQVHEARLKDGTLVAVKLRRLGIESRIRADIRIIGTLLLLFRPLFNEFTKHSLESLLAEFSAMLVKEADMDRERANLEKFRRAYGHLDAIAMPETYPALSNREALVMSFESGVRIDDPEGLAALGVDFPTLMEAIITFYTEQMLVRGFFHADPHPGNLLVRLDDWGRPVLVLLDYGMVKRLSKTLRMGMIEFVKAAHERDYETYIAAAKRIGVVAATAPDAAMWDFAERMFDIMGDDSLSGASMQELAFDVLDSMQELPFKLPQEVVFVMRVSGLIEGLGTRYIDNYNGVKDILPVLLANLPRALGNEDSFLSLAKKELTALPLTYVKAKQVLTELSTGQLPVKLAPETRELLLGEAKSMLRPLVQGLALVLAGFYLRTFAADWALAGSVACFLAGGVRIFLGIR